MTNVRNERKRNGKGELTMKMRTNEMPIYNVVCEADGKWSAVALGYTSKEEAQVLVDKKNAFNEKAFGKYNIWHFYVVDAENTEIMGRCDFPQLVMY